MKDLTTLGLRQWLVVMTDIQRYGPASRAQQVDLLTTLGRARDAALSELRLDLRTCFVQPHGDGDLVGWPDNADHYAIVTNYADLLARHLDEMNIGRMSDHRTRIRVAMALGPGQVVGGSLIGSAAVAASSLAESDPVRQALEVDSDQSVALIVDRAVRSMHASPESVPSDRFVKVSFTDKRQHSLEAWITLPGAERATLSALAAQLIGIRPRPPLDRPAPGDSKEDRPASPGEKVPSVETDDPSPADPIVNSGRRRLFSWPPTTLAALITVGGAVIAAAIPYALSQAADGGTIESPPATTAPAPISRGVGMWSIATNPAKVDSLRSWPSTNGVSALDFDPLPGGTLAAGTVDGTVVQYDVRERKLVRTLKPFRGAVEAVAFSPADHSLAVANADGTVLVYGTNGDQPIRELRPGGGAIHALAFNTIGDTLVVAGDDGAVRVYDGHGTRRVRVLPKPPGGGTVKALAFNQDSDTLVVGGTDGTARWYDGHGTKLVGQLPRPPAGGEIRTLTFNPSGDTLAVAGGDGVVREYDGRTAAAQPVRSREKIVGAINSLAYNKAGDTLLAAGDDGYVRSYDAHGESPVKTLPRSPGLSAVYALAVDFTGQAVVGGGAQS